VRGISTIALGVGMLVLGTAALAQERDEGERSAARAVPLQVQLVVTKQLGDKKISSLAYSIPCSPGDRKAALKLGVEVPVPVRKAETVEFQYRNVGTNLECDSRAVAEGRFNVRIAFEQSSLLASGEKGSLGPPASETRAVDAPFFRTAMSQFSATLRGGETAQAVTGTDPLTGEATVVDVTLKLLK
jgi:hypothetical protein